MKITPKQYAQSLWEVIKDKPEEEIKISLRKFVAILGANRVLNKAPEIITNFLKIWDEAHGELTANLISARELGPTAKELVIDYLKAKTGVKKIRMIEKIDQDLIGGFVLRYNDQIIDGSLKGSLEDLKNKISN